MSKYTCEEVEKIVKNWLGREVKDRVKEVDEPLRMVWNDSHRSRMDYIVLNDSAGLSTLLSGHSYAFIVKSTCDGNWRESAIYLQLVLVDGEYRLMGYDRIEEFPNFIRNISYIISKWSDESVNEFFGLGDKWEYGETISAWKNIEEYDMIVYKNGEPVGKIKVEKVYSTISGKVKCSTTIEGDHVEEGHLVIRSNYEKSPMEILNDFGYKEYDFKRK